MSTKEEKPEADAQSANATKEEEQNTDIAKAEGIKVEEAGQQEGAGDPAEKNDQEEEEVGFLASLFEKLGINNESELPLEIRNVLQSAGVKLAPKPYETPGRESGPILKGGTTLESVAAYISSGKAKKICVLAGAGISVSCGIPDFRTPGTGLYDNLQRYKLPRPEAIFTLDYFRSNPKPFYLLAKEMLPGSFKPSPTHFFISLLHQKGLLHHHFTQNIDMLERVAKVPEELLTEAHGNFAHAHCIDCHQAHSYEFVKEFILLQQIPRCKTCQGIVKPDIVFFGESLPASFFKARDHLAECDLLLVMGTSLTVYPFASLVDMCGQNIPRVLFNREAVGPFQREFSSRDVKVLKDCDAGVFELCKILGWEEELRELIKAGEEEFNSKQTPTSE